VFGSFPVGKVLGIQVRIHWLFPAMILFFIWRATRVEGGDSWSGTVVVSLYLAVLFGVVFLHELGHSLVARRLGVRVLDITFWPLGGMARMTEIPRRPRVEALIAGAGPAVNFALAGLGHALELLAGYEHRRGGAAPAQLAELVASAFVDLNLVLGLFNLIPAFPMDGGRLLRAALGRFSAWTRATEQAVFVGRILAVAMIVVGLFHPAPQVRMLPLIGLFVWWSGARELWAVRARAARDVLFGPEREAEAEAILEPAPRAAGAADRATNGLRPEVDPSRARRPEAPLDPREFAGSRRLDDDALARLERYQGRLRGFDSKDGVAVDPNET
jgi:Zn-dependent protease